MTGPDTDVVGADLFEWFRSLQGATTQALAALDGEATFLSDGYSSGHATGECRVLASGQVFEAASVDVYVREAAEQEPEEVGLRMAVHPHSPMVPAMYAALGLQRLGDAAWTRGHVELVPYYPRAEDVAYFHRTLRNVCEQVRPGWYEPLKAMCDAHTTLSHRGEMRGVGGVAFRGFGSPSPGWSDEAGRRMFPVHDVDLDRALELIQELGRALLTAYVPLVQSRRLDPWTERERQWQLLRRGRWVEWELLRLNEAGLAAEAEPRFSSLPPLVRWTYDYAPEPGTAEQSLAAFLQPHDWANWAPDIPPDP